MTLHMQIRETRPDDRARILALYPLMFPDEELRPVVSDLLDLDTGVLSLAGFDGPDPVAHVLFTLGNTGGDARRGALLGPLGVLPRAQRQGVGRSLVNVAFEQLDRIGVCQVFVLGDPAYYTGFGFHPEHHVSTPCPIPEDWKEAWQSLTLGDRKPLAPGVLQLPQPWRDPGLWTA